MSPRISIVIPHFERVELLRETLDSVRQQTFAEWEVRIVDDGSKPETWAALQTLADGERVFVAQREGREKGPSACRNIGAENACGDWLLFLDSDDLLAPWCLQQRVNAMAQSKADFIVFPVGIFENEIGDTPQLWNAMELPQQDIERFLISDSPWHTSSPIWRRESFLRIGGFNEKVFYGDDSDLHTRALLAGLKYSKESEALPDAFVRRGAQERITSEITEKTYLNRRQRLTECSRSLREAQASAHLQELWAGQYFIEAEFLLFNLKDNVQAVHSTLQEMQRECELSMFQRAVIRSYFAIALRCKVKAYFLLRLARRIAMATLPKSYFAKPTPEGPRHMGNDVLARVKQALTDARPAAVKPQ